MQTNQVPKTVGYKWGFLQKLFLYIF